MTKTKTIRTFLTDMCVSIAPPLIVLALQYVRMYTLPTRAEFDVLAHVLGGAAVAWTGMILLERWRRRGWVTLRPFVLRDYLVFSSVALIGVVWEFWEFVMQATTGDIYQISIADTMNDLFMDLIGALLLIAVYRIIRHVQQLRKTTSSS